LSVTAMLCQLTVTAVKGNGATILE
jgi:hypothetical protein